MRIEFVWLNGGHPQVTGSASWRGGRLVTDGDGAGQIASMPIVMLGEGSDALEVTPEDGDAYLLAVAAHLDGTYRWTCLFGDDGHEIHSA